MLKGECGMIREHETRVMIVPMVCTNGKKQFRGIEENDIDIPSGWEFSAAMITPHDFGCDSWQGEEPETDPNKPYGDDDPTLKADWWKDPE